MKQLGFVVLLLAALATSCHRKKIERLEDERPWWNCYLATQSESYCCNAIPEACLFAGDLDDVHY
jgi:hypothetical protein